MGAEPLLIISFRTPPFRKAAGNSRDDGGCSPDSPVNSILFLLAFYVFVKFDLRLNLNLFGKTLIIFNQDLGHFRA